jgi:hypothetical protein
MALFVPQFGKTSAKLKLVKARQLVWTKCQISSMPIMALFRSLFQAAVDLWKNCWHKSEFSQAYITASGFGLTLILPNPQKFIANWKKKLWPKKNILQFKIGIFVLSYY